MRTLATVVFCAALFSPQTFAASPRPTAVPVDEAKAWIRHTVPLPKQIEITGKVLIPVHQVAIEPGELSAPLVAQAVKELRESLDQTSSVSNATLERFTVAFQLGGPKTQRLKGLKNSDQAYRITPVGRSDGLELVALSPRGLYYAAKTLQQLIKAKLADGKAEMPLVTVTDWPDIEDRGIWGVDAVLHIRWLSDRKINYMEQTTGHYVDENKRAVVKVRGLDRRMIDEGPIYGIKPVPTIVHLERLGHKGVFEAYPDLKAKGEGVHEGAACYSNPKIIDILADWMIGYAQLPGVTEVDVWLTENLAKKHSCQCERCRTQNRDLLEASAIVAAYQKARKRVPDLVIHVLTSEETDDSNEQIFAMLPPEIKIWYYHSLFTYNTSEIEMIPPYVEQLAKQGRFIGVVPNLCASVIARIVGPFTGAHFVHNRMNEFVSKGLSGLLGYPKPRVFYNAFNVEATAEWSWNAKGRSPHEFALSWAVRQGMHKPELFAEWSDTIGPVAWDVYGSAWPVDEKRRAFTGVAEQLKKDQLPELGSALNDGAYPKPWGDIKTPQQLDENVTRAQRALLMARQMGIPQFVQESLVVQGYINSLKALYELKKRVIPQGIAPGDRQAANQYFQMYAKSLVQARDAVVAWEQTLPADKAYTDRPRTRETVNLLDRLIKEMADVAAGLAY